MKEEIRELKGGNMDIDLLPVDVSWEQDKCPWNENEKISEHKCAVKNVSFADISEELKNRVLFCAFT